MSSNFGNFCNRITDTIGVHSEMNAILDSYSENIQGVATQYENLENSVHKRLNNVGHLLAQVSTNRPLICKHTADSKEQNCKSIQVSQSLSNIHQHPPSSARAETPSHGINVFELAESVLAKYMLFKGDSTAKEKENENGEILKSLENLPHKTHEPVRSQVLKHKVCTSSKENEQNPGKGVFKNKLQRNYIIQKPPVKASHSSHELPSSSSDGVSSSSSDELSSHTSSSKRKKPISWFIAPKHGIIQKEGGSEGSDTSLQEAFYRSCPNILRNKHKKFLRKLGIIQNSASTAEKSELHKVQSQASSTVKQVDPFCRMHKHPLSRAATRSKTLVSNSRSGNGPESIADNLKHCAKMFFGPHDLFSQKQIKVCEDALSSLTNPNNNNGDYLYPQYNAAVPQIRRSFHRWRAWLFSIIVREEARRGRLNWSLHEVVLPIISSETKCGFFVKPKV